MFEPGQLTREAEALDARLIKQARAELDAAEDYDVNRRCPNCGAKMTVQITAQGYQSHCTPCERRTQAANAQNN